MAISRTIRRQLQALIAPAAFLLLTGYFSWSATQGDRGLETYGQKQEQLVWAKQEQQAVFNQRDAWERRVLNLRPQHLDSDTLDERTRLMLNYADPSDVVVMYGPQNKLF